MATHSSIINTQIDYKAIKNWLAYGELKDLALKSRISYSSAQKILKGEQKNFDFLEACMEKAIKNASRFKALQDRLHDNIVNS